MRDCLYDPGVICPKGSRYTHIRSMSCLGPALIFAMCLYSVLGHDNNLIFISHMGQAQMILCTYAINGDFFHYC